MNIMQSISSCVKSEMIDETGITYGPYVKYSTSSHPIVLYHFKGKHLGEMIHQCPYCTFTTWCNTQLNQHLKH